MATITLSVSCEGRTQEIACHVAMPAGQAKGVLAVLHEAFGVTPHMESVCAQYAAAGYVCVAPALYAWASGKPAGEVLPQDKSGLDAGRELILATSLPQLVATVAAIGAWGAQQGLKLGTLGYCWGGSVAYFAASQLPQVQASVAYYGGMLAELTAKAQPKCRTLVHLATQDRYIPLRETCAAFAAHHPAATVQVYEADHGFNRDDGKTYDEAAAGLAKQRTLELLAEVFGK
jgi:carboxymethylenebutenolidase